MSVREIKIFISFSVFLFSCSESLNENKLKLKSIEVAGANGYNNIYKLLNDTLTIWKQYKIFGSLDSVYSIQYSDSLLCFNQNADRLITCILNKYVNKKEKSVADGINFFYGEKIDKKWYFFKGPYIHIPREIIKNHDIQTPLDYQQLHQIALKEVYSGYLSRGEINEDWFTNHFENSGYGNFNDQESSLKFLHTDRKFTDKRKFFEAIHLQSVRNNWYGINKDSIKQLPAKIEKLP